MTSPTLDRRQGLVGNVPIKAAVLCATTGPITLSGEQVIDGVQTNGSRVLVRLQADPTQNGIYDSSSAAWTRSADADGNYDLATNTLVSVISGNLAGGAFYGLTTQGPITIGTSPLNWTLSIGPQLGTSLAGPAGSLLIGFKLNAIQSATRLVGLKLSEWVSVTDFNNADGSQVLGDYNGVTGRDNTTGFQAAVNYCELSSSTGTYGTNSPANGSCALFVPSGNYKCNGTIVVTSKMHVIGDGPAERSTGSRMLQFNNAVDLWQIAPQAAGMSWSIVGMTLAGTASGAGHLIHVKHTTAACNSGRIVGNFFGTPPALAVQIDCGDDWLVSQNVVDSSNGSAFGFGTSTAADVVSALRVLDNDFFEVPTHCILLYNVDGYKIGFNRVTRQSASRTNNFINAVDTLPYQVKNGVVFENVVTGVDYFMRAMGFSGLSLTGNRGKLMGPGAGAAHSCFEWTGTCDDLVMGKNSMTCSYDTKNVYNDAGGTVTNVNHDGNTYIDSAGSGTAVVGLNSTGRLGPNTLTGFVRNYQLNDYLAAGLPLTESQTLTYGASIAIDASLGSILTVNATNNTGFAFANPSNLSIGQLIEITVRNTSAGALGAGTFGTLYKLGAAWTQPAAGTSRAITFRYNGTNLVEKSRTAADVAN